MVTKEERRIRRDTNWSLGLQIQPLHKRQINKFTIYILEIIFSHLVINYTRKESEKEHILAIYTYTHATDLTNHFDTS